MTLIEMLVAIFLVGIALTLTLYTLLKVNELWNRTRHVAALERNARRVLSRLSTELRSTIAAGDSSGLELRVSSKRTSVTDIDGDTIAVPNDTLLIHNPAENLTKQLNLATVKQWVAGEMKECLTGLDFKFLDPGGGWREDWQGGGMPEAVKISLIIHDKYMNSYRVRFTEISVPQ